MNYQNGCFVYLCDPVPHPRLVSFITTLCTSARCTTFLGREMMRFLHFFCVFFLVISIVCIWLLFAIVFRSVDGECGVIFYGYWGHHDACHRWLSAVCISNFMGRGFDDCARLSYHLKFSTVSTICYWVKLPTYLCRCSNCLCQFISQQSLSNNFFLEDLIVDHPI